MQYIHININIYNFFRSVPFLPTRRHFQIYEIISVTETREYPIFRCLTIVICKYYIGKNLRFVTVYNQKNKTILSLKYLKHNDKII